MSAKERRHEGAPKKIDERVISEERHSWIQTLGSEGIFALAEERARDADQRPEYTSGERDETRDRLLSAINDTESARLIRGLMPADDRQPHARACAEPPKALFPAPRAEAQPSARVVRQAPAVRPARAFLVQASPFAASMPLMPPAAAPSSDPAFPGSDSIVEKDNTRDSLLRAISATQIARQLGGEIAASNPQFRKLVQTSPQAASIPLMPPSSAPPHRRVSAVPLRVIEAAASAAIPQVPSPPQPVAAAAGPIPAVTAPLPPAPAQVDFPRATNLVSSNGEINRLGTKLPLATRSVGRPTWRLSVQFKNRAVAKAALAMESTSRAATQLSIQFKDWMEAKAAPAMERLGRSVWQLSIRSWNWAKTRAALTVESTSRATTQNFNQFEKWRETKAAPATERLGRSAWQLSTRLWNRANTRAAVTVKSTNVAASQPSTRLDDRSPAAPNAPAMEMNQSRQSPTRFKMWFGPRRSPRLAKPPVVAYCWTADTPHAIKIADISSGGVHLLTDVRWPRGGAFSMTLQRTDRTKEMPGSWIVIDFMVTRYCDDGVAGAFIPSTHRLSPYIPCRAENCADEWTLKRFVKHLAVS